VLRADLRRTAAEDGLEPVHILALWYLTQANRFSDNPVSVADYLGLTKGNVSQRLNVLEARGLVRKATDAEDRRKVHLEVTARGRKVLNRNYPPRSWPGRIDEVIEAGLSRLLGEMVASGSGARTFGQCRTCRFHESSSSAGSPPFCGLLHVPLTGAQAGQLCREHEGRK
jgi:DNA-binding MarR family transcriptional regulator